MSEKRTQREPERAPEPQRKDDRLQNEPKREPEALDEQALDDVLRDCPL